MKNIGYTLASLTVLAISAYYVLGLVDRSPFPPIDPSSEYDYCVIDGSVYLELVRHGIYVFITQYGVMYSKDPNLVKRDRGHDKVYELFHGEFETSQEFDEELARYNAWEDEYNEIPTSRINLKNAEIRVRIPKNKNPYDWKPDDEAQSFREHYVNAEGNTFRRTVFYDTKHYL